MGLYPFVFGENVEDRTENLLYLQSPSSVTGLPQDVYSVLVITDPHFGSDRAELEEDAFYKWFKNQLENDDETLRPRFMICLGDILDGGHKKEAESYNKFTERLKQMAELSGITGFETYSILGNHDLYNHGWSVWKENIKPYTSFYTFSTKTSLSQGFSWYFLDTANGTLGKNQLELLSSSMKKDPLSKIVSMHYPLYCDGVIQLAIQNSLERNMLFSLFAQNDVKLVLEGHAHTAKDYDSGIFKEHLIPSFLYSRTVCLLTVDESNGSVKAFYDLEY